MIRKFQRPLFSSDGNTDVLAYDKSREFEATLPMTPGLLALFDDEPKFFADCDVSNIHDAFRIAIKNKVADPGW